MNCSRIFFDFFCHKIVSRSTEIVLTVDKFVSRDVPNKEFLSVEIFPIVFTLNSRLTKFIVIVKGLLSLNLVRLILTTRNSISSLQFDLRLCCCTSIEFYCDFYPYYFSSFVYWYQIDVARPRDYILHAESSFYKTPFSAQFLFSSRISPSVHYLSHNSPLRRRLSNTLFEIHHWKRRNFLTLTHNSTSALRL